MKEGRKEREDICGCGGVARVTRLIMRRSKNKQGRNTNVTMRKVSPCCRVCVLVCCRIHGKTLLVKDASDTDR